MNYHLVPLSKGLLAILARVGPSVGVDPLVFPKQVAALEVLGAVDALEGTLACKRASLFLKPTYVHTPWFYSWHVRTCVRAPDVKQELRPPDKGRTASLTHVRLLSSVGASGQEGGYNNHAE